jgi:hypothetical protein
METAIANLKWEQMFVNSKVYTITFETEAHYQKYRRCYKKVGRGEGADWILKSGYSEEGLLKTLEKTPGYTVEFSYELGGLKNK